MNKDIRPMCPDEIIADLKLELSEMKFTADNKEEQEKADIMKAANEAYHIETMKLRLAAFALWIAKGLRGNKKPFPSMSVSSNKIFEISALLVEEVSKNILKPVNGAVLEESFFDEAKPLDWGDLEYGIDT